MKHACRSPRQTSMLHVKFFPSPGRVSVTSPTAFEPLFYWEKLIARGWQRTLAVRHSADTLSASNSGGRPAKTGLLNYANSSTSATGRRGFCGQFPGRSAPTDNSMTGTSSSASANSQATASASKPIIGVEPRPSERAA
jgi:hypothetical protein